MTLPQGIPSSFHASISTATHVCSVFKTFFYTSYQNPFGGNSQVLLCTYRSKHINPIAANDQFTGRYYATPECRMTGFTGYFRQGLNSSLEEKCSLSNSVNPNPSVLCLFFNQNEEFAKSDICIILRLLTPFYNSLVERKLSKA